MAYIYEKRTKSIWDFHDSSKDGPADYLMVTLKSGNCIYLSGNYDGYYDAVQELLPLNLQELLKSKCNKVGPIEGVLTCRDDPMEQFMKSGYIGHDLRLQIIFSDGRDASLQLPMDEVVDIQSVPREDITPSDRVNFFYQRRIDEFED